MHANAIARKFNCIQIEHKTNVNYFSFIFFPDVKPLMISMRNRLSAVAQCFCNRFVSLVSHFLWFSLFYCLAFCLRGYPTVLFIVLFSDFKNSCCCGCLSCRFVICPWYTCCLVCLLPTVLHNLFYLFIKCMEPLQELLSSALSFPLSRYPMLVSKVVHVLMHHDAEQINTETVEISTDIFRV